MIRLFAAGFVFTLGALTAIAWAPFIAAVLELAVKALITASGHSVL